MRERYSFERIFRLWLRVYNDRQTPKANMHVGGRLRELRVPSLHPGGGGLFSYKRLLGMCRWMGSHFHDWIDYKGVMHLSVSSPMGGGGGGGRA